MKNIYTKLMEVRVAFHKLELKKSGHNKFAGFKYYELGDFLVPATKLLQEANLCPMISFNNEIATMTLINGDNPEEQITFTSPMRELSLKGTNEIQNLGGIQTYLTRYLYIQLLNVVEADSFDAVSGRDDKSVPSRNQSTETKSTETKGEFTTMADLTGKLTTKQINRLMAIGKKANVTEAQILTAIKRDYNKTEISQLTRKEYDDICTRLEAKASA